MFCFVWFVFFSCDWTLGVSVLLFWYVKDELLLSSSSFEQRLYIVDNSGADASDDVVVKSVCVQFGNETLTTSFQPNDDDDDATTTPTTSSAESTTTTAKPLGVVSVSVRFVWSICVFVWCWFACRGWLRCAAESCRLLSNSTITVRLFVFVRFVVFVEIESLRIARRIGDSRIGGGL